MATCTRTIFLALLVIGNYQWQVSTVTVLTPSTTLSACPGDEAVINCYESETTANTRISLRWQITLMNRSIPVIELRLIDIINNTSRREGRLEFHAEWISYSPLSAILTTTAHSALDGATVTCAVGGSASQGPLIIRVPQIAADQPELRWLNITGGWFEADSLTVIIEWEGNSDCLNFTVSLTSPTDASSDYSITTRNRSHTFNILYNTNYTVTLTVGGNNSDEISKTFNFNKCEPPSHQENVVVNGYVSPALENAQIFISCLPGYSLPRGEVIVSTCTSEAVWSPDLLDLECQRKLINDPNAVEDCVQLSSVSGAYRILNQTNTTSYSEGLLVEFQCVHTPYKIDPLFTTECQAGQWNPHPRDICGHLQGEIPVIVSLGAVIALLCVVVGTLTALLITTHKYYLKKVSRASAHSFQGINVAASIATNVLSSGDQLQGSEVIPGSGQLTPNVIYEPIIISQKHQVSRGDMELERNPAYTTTVVHM